MITLKSPDEIASIMKAGAIVRQVLKGVEEAIRPGVTTLELDSLAEEIIRRGGGTPAFKGYRGFPANICASVNEVVVHGIPSGMKLKEGDMISIDVGVGIEGYFADAAATFGVRRISKEAERLAIVTREALAIAIDKARPDNRSEER